MKRNGFSLIEMLLAMTLLIILIGFVTQVHTETFKLRSTAYATTDIDATARAAMALIARDLEHAIANTNTDLTFALYPESFETNAATCYSLPHTNSAITFCALLDDSSDPSRAAQRVGYRVQQSPELTNSLGGTYYRYELVKDRWMLDNYLGDLSSSATSVVVAENVAYFGLLAGTTNNSAVDTYPPDGNTNVLPVYVDICLDLIPEDTAIKASSITTNLDSFIDRATHRFTTRVFIPNRTGCKQR